MALRQAAQELVDALTKRPARSYLTAVALEQLEQALADDEPTTDELLERLQPGHTLELRAGFVNEELDYYAIVNTGPFQAARNARGWPADGRSPSPAEALRAALLQLPAPTEPPPPED